MYNFVLEKNIDWDIIYLSYSRTKQMADVLLPCLIIVWLLSIVSIDYSESKAILRLLYEYIDEQASRTCIQFVAIK